MKPYAPRRQSPRWLDADCPAEVLAIYDNPNFADRYTVFYSQLHEYPDTHDTALRGFIFYRAMSENPFHPCGVGISGEMRAHQVAAYRYENRNRACRWSDLPDKVRECVLQDVADFAA